MDEADFKTFWSKLNNQKVAGDRNCWPCDQLFSRKCLRHVIKVSYLYVPNRSPWKIDKPLYESLLLHTLVVLSYTLLDVKLTVQRSSIIQADVRVDFLRNYECQRDFYHFFFFF